MFLKKQKIQQFRRLSRVSVNQVSNFLVQYRSLIAPVQFHLNEIQTFGAFTHFDCQNMENIIISDHNLKDLIVNATKLTVIYEALTQVLEKNGKQHKNVNLVIGILHRGLFYGYLPSNQGQLKMLVNNRSTEANIKILIAALLAFASKKMSIQEISTALLFFALEASLYQNPPLKIPLDNHKVLKVLKKIERCIKPSDYKVWLEGMKNADEGISFMQAHHFLYLCVLTEKKHTSRLGSILFKDIKNQGDSLIKNMNINLKFSSQNDQKEVFKEVIEEDRKIIRGLSLCDLEQRKTTSFSREILRQFRLRDPSKHRRPNTAQLRRHVSAYINKQSHFKMLELNGNYYERQRQKNKKDKKDKKMIKYKMTDNVKNKFKLKIGVRTVHQKQNIVQKIN